MFTPSSYDVELRALGFCPVLSIAKYDSFRPQFRLLLGVLGSWIFMLRGESKMGRQSKPGFGHPRCFARALLECSTEIDQEHYVPETSLLAITHGKESIFVRNLGSQKNRKTGTRLKSAGLQV